LVGANVRYYFWYYQIIEKKYFLKKDLDGITAGITFAFMALVQKPTKLSPLVLENIKKDVKAGVFPNDNFAINEILKKYYNVPSEFQISKSQKEKK